MRYLALATDYDGTLAHDGIVADATLTALERLKASGRRLLLVTGRELKELQIVFPGCNWFDLIVAENGALLYEPSSQQSRLLGPMPPPQFIARLQADNVPISIGQSIVATVEPYEHPMLAAIRDLGIEWHVIFNKGSVMALPSTINKATGLTAALEQLQLGASQVVAVGDAENDHAFLQMCGCAVAVANSIESLKQESDWITQGARGAGVVELIDAMVIHDLEAGPIGAQAGSRRRKSAG